MPRQLIYTSAPRGLIPGQSGYCTVARSRDLREALIPRIEKLSYYTHEPNQRAVVCAHRILDLRGTKFHILSRIVDSGHDFTKRRGFLAHHLIFDPVEIASAATPAEIFANWKGWLDRWIGEPQWLEDNPPLPARENRPCTIAKCDAWITGDENDRTNFLPTLTRRGADWGITFTNYFQPGDNPNDFDIKAAWPNTTGYEAAKRLGASFIRLDELPQAAQLRTAPVASTTPQPVSTPTTALSTTPARNPVTRYLPIATALAAALAFVVTLAIHNAATHRSVQQTPAPAVIQQEPPFDLAAELDVLLPNRPTWLAMQNVPTALPPIEKLMAELRANEVFTKDLSATLQANLHSTPIPASLFADPTQNRLRFYITNSPPIEISVSKGCRVSGSSRESVAVEIPGRFRLLDIKAPVELSRRFLRSGTNIELQADLEKRAQGIELPPGAQLALRPLVFVKGEWIDPLAAVAGDFAIVPSTILDLSAVEEHARKVVSDKESKLRTYEEEQTSLAAEQQKLLTDAQTPGQLKGKERLNVLQLAIPKAKQELQALRAKAESIPKDISRIERFALFLCLSNVETEIFRFSDKP